MKLSKKQATNIGGIIVLLVIVYWLRPFFHPLVMWLWTNPLACLMFFIGIILMFKSLAPDIINRLNNVALKGKKQPEFTPQKATVIGLFLVLASFFVGAIGNDLRMAQLYKATKFETAKSLPETDQNRVVPYAVAERFGADALQRPADKAFDWHAQNWDGKFSWVSLLSPNGALRYWTGNASGVQTVDATKVERNTSVEDQKFTISEGVALTDNIHWKLLKKQYLADIPEVYYGKVDGKIYSIAPIISYKGFPVRYPVLGGVFVVSPSGDIKKLSPAEAQNNDIIKSAGRLYPESYIKQVHESYAYKNGLFNKWFKHIDQTEISNPEGESNIQPYMLSTKDGLTWLSAADPWGKSFGVYKIFTTNAMTGKISVYSLPKESALTGASQTIGYVKSAKPQYNWQVTNSEDGTKNGNIVAVEPRPVIINKQFFWMVSVTTNESKGINETCFIDSKNNKVTCAKDDNEIKAFLSTGSTEAATDASVGTDAAEPSTGVGNPGIAASDAARIESIERQLQQVLDELQKLKQSAAPSQDTDGGQSGAIEPDKPVSN